MKKALFIFAILGLIAASYAQNKQTNIQIGTLKPKATDSGLIISLGVGRDYDERVELGFSGEIFTVKQTEEERINWYDPNTSTYVDTVVTNFESSILMFPILANINIKFPGNFPVIPYAGGGLGFTMLTTRYKNYQTDTGETNLYIGFGYRLCVGGIYPLGRRSALTGEIFYNSSKPSHKEETDIGLPTRTEMDMSGLGIRIGIKLGTY